MHGIRKPSTRSSIYPRPTDRFLKLVKAILSPPSSTHRVDELSSPSASRSFLARKPGTAAACPATKPIHVLLPITL